MCLLLDVDRMAEAGGQRCTPGYLIWKIGQPNETLLEHRTEHVIIGIVTEIRSKTLATWLSTGLLHSAGSHTPIGNTSVIAAARIPGRPFAPSPRMLSDHSRTN